jgi:hypothetical protein
MMLKILFNYLQLTISYQYYMFPCLAPNDVTKIFSARSMFYSLKFISSTQLGDNFYLKT